MSGCGVLPSCQVDLRMAGRTGKLASVLQLPQTEVPRLRPASSSKSRMCESGRLQRAPPPRRSVWMQHYARAKKGPASRPWDCCAKHHTFAMCRLVRLSLRLLFSVFVQASLQPSGGGQLEIVLGRGDLTRMRRGCIYFQLSAATSLFCLPAPGYRAETQLLQAEEARNRPKALRPVTSCPSLDVLAENRSYASFVEEATEAITLR